MATKATAKNEVWKDEGARCGRVISNPDTADYLKQQVRMSVQMYSRRTDRQAKSWMDGYLRVVGY